jgi:NAD(P)-dependent dehydrogenase (short-subunit alcohol dehydrogenase family)
MAPFGIRVVLIEPSATRTRLAANAIYAGEQDDGPYAQFNKDVARWNAMAVSGPPYNLAGRLAPSADKVARVITRAVTSRKPRARYSVGTLAPVLFMMRRLLPTAAFDAFVRRQFPVPAASSGSQRPAMQQAVPGR